MAGAILKTTGVVIFLSSAIFIGTGECFLSLELKLPFFWLNFLFYHSSLRFS